MATATPQANRTTRSSTRSQTSTSRHAAQSGSRSSRTEGTGRVEKHQTKPIGGSKKAAKPKPNPKASKSVPETKPKQSNKAEPEHPKPESSISAPRNVTVITIDSGLAKNPIICHQYTPSTPPTSASTADHSPFIFTHGAGGTVSAPAVVNFCTGFSSTSPSPLIAFQGSMNLGGRVKGFYACRAHLGSHNGSLGGAVKTLVLGGRSMGARAAVIAATELAAEAGIEASVKVRLVLVSYPLQGPKDVRDGILLALPKEVEVLFIVGDKDAMCPLELMEGVRKKMTARNRLVVVRGADHGMNIKPAKRTTEVGEETGRVAARWSGGDIEGEGEVLYVGE